MFYLFLYDIPFFFFKKKKHPLNLVYLPMIRKSFNLEIMIILG
jgi:hypothetical protein